jgi:glucose-1-phosphate thymidylyltransferase
VALGQLNVKIMGRGYAWLDTGSHFQIAGRRQLHKHPSKAPRPASGLPRRNCLCQKWIDAEQIQMLAAPLAKNGYGQYLLGLLK